jgi:hypothetical protein
MLKLELHITKPIISNQWLSSCSEGRRITTLEIHQSKSLRRGRGTLSRIASHKFFQQTGLILHHLGQIGSGRGWLIRSIGSTRATTTTSCHPDKRTGTR